jgi:hypothetical protein
MTEVKTDRVLSTSSEVIKKVKSCFKCSSPIGIEKEDVAKGLAIGTCSGCGTPYSNIKPTVVDGKWTYPRTDEFHEMKPVIPF